MYFEISCSQRYFLWRRLKAGAGVTGRVKNKSGVTKGGQNVLLGNVNIIRTHVYMHRQMLYMKPPDWKVMGDIEAENIMEYLKPMI